MSILDKKSSVKLNSGQLVQGVAVVDSDGNQVNSFNGEATSSGIPARTPTTTSVASSATSVTILAANSGRKGLSVANDSTASLRLSFTSPATTTNAFIVLPPGSFILLDQQLIVGNAIYGVWSAVNGTAQVTEYV